MPDMDEADAVLLFPEGLDDAVYSIAGDTEDCINAPFHKAFYHHIRCIGHGVLLESLVSCGRQNVFDRWDVSERKEVVRRNRYQAAFPNEMVSPVGIRGIDREVVTAR